MHHIDISANNWHPVSDADQVAVREQLERVLASPLFSNSKRYPALLRHVVEESLQGHTDNLKERALGIDVFKRDPYYDTNADPVVRVTAGEIRKRLAQYYYESASADEIHIGLSPGSYIPEFRLPEMGRVPLPDRLPIASSSFEPGGGQPALGPQVTTPLGAPGDLPESKPGKAGHRRALLGAVTLLLIGAAAVFAVRQARDNQRILDQFWRPVINSSRPALLCLGDRASWDTSRAAAGIPDAAMRDLTVGDYIENQDHVVLTDVLALNRLAATLQELGKGYRIKSASATDLSDLRDGPAVLIGGNNNGWTVRLTAPLRFSFVLEAAGGRIVDKDNPAQTSWAVPLSTPYRRLSEDYGIVARLKDPTTDQPVIIAAGLAAQGTIATGEMLSNPEYLRGLVSRAPKGWQNMNLEAVIATQVIDGKSGPPRVLAAHFW